MDGGRGVHALVISSVISTKTIGRSTVRVAARRVGFALVALVALVVLWGFLRPASAAHGVVVAISVEGKNKE